MISLLDLNAELFEDFLYYFIYQSVLEYFIYQMWKLSLVSYMKLKINFIRRYYYYFRLVLLLTPWNKDNVISTWLVIGMLKYLILQYWKIIEM